MVRTESCIGTRRNAEDLQSVEVVNLDNNNIGDEGAEAFATLLASISDSELSSIIIIYRTLGHGLW